MIDVLVSPSPDPSVTEDRSLTSYSKIAFIPQSSITVSPLSRPSSTSDIFEIQPTDAYTSAANSLFNIPDTSFDPTLPQKVSDLLSALERYPSTLGPQWRLCKRLKHVLEHVGPRACLNQVSPENYNALANLWNRWLDVIDILVGLGHSRKLRKRLIKLDDLTAALHVASRAPRSSRESEASTTQFTNDGGANIPANKELSLGRILETISSLGFKLNAMQLKIILQRYTASQILTSTLSGWKQGNSPSPQDMHKWRVSLQSDEGAKIIKDGWRARRALEAAASQLITEVTGKDEAKVVQEPHSSSVGASDWAPHVDKPWDVQELQNTVSELVLTTLEDAARLSLPLSNFTDAAPPVNTLLPTLRGELNFWLRRRDELHSSWLYRLDDGYFPRFRAFSQPPDQTENKGPSAEVFTPSIKESVVIWLLLRDRLLPPEWRCQPVSAITPEGENYRLGFNLQNPIDLVRLQLGFRRRLPSDLVTDQPVERHVKFDKRIMACIIRLWSHYQIQPSTFSSSTRSIQQNVHLINLIALLSPSTSHPKPVKKIDNIVTLPAPPLDIRLFKRMLLSPRDPWELHQILPALSRLPPPPAGMKLDLGGKELYKLMAWWDAGFDGQSVVKELGNERQTSANDDAKSGHADLLKEVLQSWGVDIRRMEREPLQSVVQTKEEERECQNRLVL